MLFTVHSLLVEEERSNDVDLAAAVRWQEALLARCDKVAVVSSSERERYHALGYDRLNPRVSVVHNSIAEPPRFRARRGRRTLGFSGRLIPRKRPERRWSWPSRSTPAAGRHRRQGLQPYARDLVDELGLNERAGVPGLVRRRQARSVLRHDRRPGRAVCLRAVRARGARGGGTRRAGRLHARRRLVEVLGDAAIYCEDTTYEAFRDAVDRWAGAGRDALERLALAARANYEARFTDVHMARAYRRLFARMA